MDNFNAHKDDSYDRRVDRCMQWLRPCLCLSSRHREYSTDNARLYYTRLHYTALQLELNASGKQIQEVLDGVRRSGRGNQNQCGVCSEPLVITFCLAI